jgi:hypothetical protein
VNIMSVNVMTVEEIIEVSGAGLGWDWGGAAYGTVVGAVGGAVIGASPVVWPDRLAQGPERNLA